MGIFFCGAVAAMNALFLTRGFNSGDDDAALFRTIGLDPCVLARVTIFVIIVQSGGQVNDVAAKHAKWS